MIAILLIALQFATFADHRKPNVLLEGNWQSCREDDGDYTERSFEYCVNGHCYWNFHMGPRDEFALFKGPEAEDHIDHDDKRNLLGPGYRANDLDTFRGKRSWNVPSLGLWISIAQAGGSRDDCDSYFVLIERRSGS